MQRPPRSKETQARQARSRLPKFEAILLAAEAKVLELQKDQKANQAQLVKLQSEISKLQKSLKSAELKKPSRPKSRRRSSPSLLRRSQQL